MLRTIQEDESDHAVNAVDSLDSLSAAAANGFEDDDDGGGHHDDDDRGSILSGAAALADPEGGARQPSKKKDGLMKEQSKKKSKRRRRRRRRIQRRWATWRSVAVMGVVVVAAVAIVVAIVVTDSGGSGDDGGGDGGNTDTGGGPSDGSSPTPAPTNSPTTAAPTIDPDVVANLDALISEINVDLSLDLSLPPQDRDLLLEARDRARNWMLTRDLLRDEVLADPTSVRFVQRYVLALAFYSIQPDNNNITRENEDANLFAEESECQWLGVVCDEQIVDKSNTTTITLPVVRRIQWDNVNAVGVLPPEIRSLRFLQELNVAKNKLHGPIPKEWFEPPSSVSTGALAESFHFLPFLYLIDFTYNDFSGDLPMELWTMPSMRFVYLTNNTFTGSFPSQDDLDAMERPLSSFLEDIWVDNNQLSGSIPAWIFSLHILRSLIVEHNDFSGTIDSILSNGIIPSTLMILDMSFNRFSGTIPHALFQAVGLMYLYLDHNEFTDLAYPNGAPEDKVLLVDVWLQANQLQGAIPRDFGEFWSELKELKMQNNQLTGTISPRGCQADQAGNSPYWPNLVVLETDCDITCVCCTNCTPSS